MMTELEMKQLLQQDGKKVEAALQELLPDDAISALQRTSVVEAMRYSLEAGGKRIRPVLVLELQDVRRNRRTGNAGCCCNRNDSYIFPDS